MAARIRTVLGDVKPTEITAALPHEHGLLDYGDGVTKADLRRALPRLRSRLVKEFRALRELGCNCFVNCGTIGGIRRPELWCEVCRKTGMHFVTSTGLYTETTLKPWVRRASVGEIADRILHEVTVGIDGTEAKAGVVKVSSNAYTVEKNEEKAFRAAAKVHRKTGVPITTHTPKGARFHVEFLRKLGVEPPKVALGHIEVDPWEDIKAVARMGAMMIFTNWGGAEWVPEDMIVAQIVELVRLGFVKQIMISVDMYLWLNKGRLVYRWPGGYTQIFDRVIPRLKKAGLKAGHIDTIVRDNPLRHLAF